MSERARSFFALWPEDPVRVRLAKLARKHLRGAGRLVARDNLHITLFFLGPLDAPAQARALAAADAVRAPPFELALDTLGMWPRPQIAWSAPTEVPSALAVLVQGLRGALAASGFEPEARPYRPHVTLARKVRRRWEPWSHRPIRWPVRTFCLVRSYTRRDGVRYEPGRSWRLAQGDPLGAGGEIWDNPAQVDR